MTSIELSMYWFLCVRVCQKLSHCLGIAGREEVDEREHSKAVSAHLIRQRAYELESIELGRGKCTDM